MIIDSEKDIEGLRKVGSVVAFAVREMKKQAREGMMTKELDEIGARFLASHGAASAPKLMYGFPGHTCISINREAAHGIPGSRTIRAGDLINIDVSAELDGYYGGHRTFISDAALHCFHHEAVPVHLRHDDEDDSPIEGRRTLE